MGIADNSGDLIKKDCSMYFLYFSLLPPRFSLYPTMPTVVFLVLLFPESYLLPLDFHKDKLTILVAVHR